MTKILLIGSLLLLVSPASPFVIPPRTSCAFQVDSRLASAVVEGTSPVAKEEKLTKEAQEFLDVLEAKKAGKGPKLLIAQTAPAVRVAISEEFGKGPSAYTPQQMVAALKALGFDLVLDTVTAADLTIMEEGTELLHRIQAHIDNLNHKKLGEDTEHEPLPMFTSCCPGWMGFIEKSNPELAPYISSCKSPHMMYGATVKAYSEELLGVPADQVYFASVMPCIKKRGESDRAAFEHDGVREIDNVITTKDMGALCRLKGIDPGDLEPVQFDSPFQKDENGEGTGAGQLFGATGGVMEAAVRTVYKVLTGHDLPRLELEAVRGLDGVKTAVIPLHDEEGNGLPIDLRVAVCSGLGNAKKLMKDLKEGNIQYDFIEVMACPGGCINGGGQPRAQGERIQERLDYIYELDQKLPRRQSHENPIVSKMYEDFFGEYGSDEAHRLLHVDPVYGELKP